MSNGYHINSAATTAATSNTQRSIPKRRILSNNAAGIHHLPAPPIRNSSTIESVIHRNSKKTAFLLSTLVFLCVLCQFALLYHHDEYIALSTATVSSVTHELVSDLEILEEEIVDIQRAAYEYNNNNNDEEKTDYTTVERISSETLEKYTQQQQQLQEKLAEFCGTCRFRDQDFDCNHRVEWVMRNKHKTEVEAKLENLVYCSKNDIRNGGSGIGTTVAEDALLKSSKWKVTNNNNNNNNMKKQSASGSSSNQAPFKLLDKENWNQYSMEPLQILKRAGVDPNEGFIPSMRMSEARKALRRNVEIERQQAQLPTLSEITSLYGNKPYIVGLERCQAYRDAVPPEYRLIGPAGLFNTATNLAANLLKINCVNNARLKTKKYRAAQAPAGVKVQAPWGKHNPVSWRLHHEAKVGGAGTNQEEFLPIVMIKDPLTWMASMCRHSYEARWRHDTKHCPNLVANKYDRGRDVGEIVPVFVKFATKHFGNEPLPDPKNRTFVIYKNLVDMWNRWYTEWMDADFPRLMVRFEDLLFHAEETISQICDCAGGQMRPRFRYIEDSAKGDSGPHAGSAGFLASLVTYGNSTKRMKDILTDEIDYEFAKQNLDETLMKEFGYAPL